MPESLDRTEAKQMSSEDCYCKDSCAGRNKNKCRNNWDVPCPSTSSAHCYNQLPPVHSFGVAQRDSCHGNDTKEYPFQTNHREDSGIVSPTNSSYPSVQNYLRGFAHTQPEPGTKDLRTARGHYGEDAIRMLDFGYRPHNFTGAMSLANMSHVTGSQGDLDDDGDTTTSGSYTVDPDDLDVSLPDINVHSTDV